LDDKTTTKKVTTFGRKLVVFEVLEREDGDEEPSVLNTP